MTYDNPGVGYYLFRCSVMDQKTGEPVVIEKPFMVSTTAVYLQAAGESDLIWLNDCASAFCLNPWQAISITCSSIQRQANRSRAS